jgi:hypothetical protein
MKLFPFFFLLIYGTIAHANHLASHTTSTPEVFNTNLLMPTNSPESLSISQRQLHAPLLSATTETATKTKSNDVMASSKREQPKEVLLNEIDTILNTPDNIDLNNDIINRFSLIASENQLLRKKLKNAKNYILYRLPPVDTKLSIETYESLSTTVELLKIENIKLKESISLQLRMKSVMIYLLGMISGLILFSYRVKKQNKNKWQ